MIPIRTDSPIRQTPWVNYALLALNVLVYLVFDASGSKTLAEFKDDYLVLHPSWPAVYQFFTYQFLHGDVLHLAGNMLFLWVFGNSVNGKMGNVAYLLFYLSGGVVAALGFAVSNPEPLLGASGAIAAVTTAFLVLFPRSRVTFLYWFIFLIGFFELPAMIIILVKIILWDNILSPQWAEDAGRQVAYSAHLYGYLFGFVVPAGMLWARALPRDQFDMIALVRRWFQRRTFAAAMSDPQNRARAQFGKMARPVSVDAARSAGPAYDKITQLRMEIGEMMNNGQTGEAIDCYLTLTNLDPRQVLSRQHQLDIGRALYATGRFPQSASAFEKYLATYPTGPDADQISLLLGIIYARDLHEYEAADKHLQSSLVRLRDEARIEQAHQWLDYVSAALGRPSPES